MDSISHAWGLPSSRTALDKDLYSQNLPSGIPKAFPGMYNLPLPLSRLNNFKVIYADKRFRKIHKTKTNPHRLIISVQLLWLFWDVSCAPCLYPSLGYISNIGIFLSCCLLTIIITFHQLHLLSSMFIANQIVYSLFSGFRLNLFQINPS